MDFDKSRTLKNWFSSLIMNYNEFRKDSKNFRCKIVSVNTDKITNETTLSVMINGIKKQVVKFLPKELVVDEAMLNEFSSFDVRAITFYALQSVNTLSKSVPKSMINGQEFINGKTIFIIKKSNQDGEERKSAHELYCDDSLLIEFGHDDLKNIISTAIQEQAIDDHKDDEE